MNPQAVQPRCTTVSAVAPRAIPAPLAAAKAVTTPLRRLRAAQARLDAAQAEFDQIRRQTVLELVDAGLSYAQVAELIGVTKSRAFQIARGTR